jgi:NitT/TauT family transport system permease protein
VRLPIVAVAPIFVLLLGNGYSPKIAIAALITFFPTLVNMVEGLESADPQALELMHVLSAGKTETFRYVRWPSSLPYLFSALRVAAAGSVVGAIVGELPSSIQDGLGGAILNFAQYYSFQPKNLWATNVIAAALGIVFFVVVVIAERAVVRRAPEHVA